MRIATIGRGSIGGGLAELWRAAGHEVTEIGREGGGYEPVGVGPLANAAMLEQSLRLIFAISKDGGIGPYFYASQHPTSSRRDRRGLGLVRRRRLPQSSIWEPIEIVRSRGSLK